MNKHQFIGNITKDAEIKNFESGRSVINFSVAVNERWMKNGEKQEKTHFFKCALWKDKDKTSIAQYLLKGTKVYCEGTPVIEVYLNKEGKPAGNIKVTVLQIELLRGNKNEQPKQEGSKKESNASTPAKEEEILVPTPDDDLPF